MFSPADAIAKLDAALAKTGQTLSFWRGDAEQDMRAFVRGYRPDELVGLLQQGDRAATISPTSFGAFGAPEAQDKVTVGGGPATVQSVELVEMAGVVVRANMVIRGD